MENLKPGHAYILVFRRKPQPRVNVKPLDCLDEPAVLLYAETVEKLIETLAELTQEAGLASAALTPDLRCVKPPDPSILAAKLGSTTLRINYATIPCRVARTRTRTTIIVLAEEIRFEKRGRHTILHVKLREPQPPETLIQHGLLPAEALQCTTTQKLHTHPHSKPRRDPRQQGR